MKTILLPFRNDAHGDAPLVTAGLLATRFDAHIEGLYVHEPAQTMVADMMPVAVVTRAEDQRSEDIDAAARTFREKLAAGGAVERALTAGGSGASMSWRDAQGVESALVGEYGRLFDLIIVGRREREMAYSWVETCEAALFDSGRPVLLSAPTPVSEIGRRIVIAWNGSTETARTIALGMPLLQRADSVLVLTVETGTVPGPSGEQVAQHLTRSGIDATAVTKSLQRRSIGEAMLEEAHAAGADLMFKGAYTQSRLRQMIFGGATNHILYNATLPVLFAN